MGLLCVLGEVGDCGCGQVDGFAGDALELVVIEDAGSDFDTSGFAGVGKTGGGVG
jgi:hypothetical protein